MICIPTIDIANLLHLCPPSLAGILVLCTSLVIVFTITFRTMLLVEKYDEGHVADYTYATRWGFGVAILHLLGVAFCRSNNSEHPHMQLADCIAINALGSCLGLYVGIAVHALIATAVGLTMEVFHDLRQWVASRQAGQAGHLSDTTVRCLLVVFWPLALVILVGILLSSIAWLFHTEQEGGRHPQHVSRRHQIDRGGR